MLNIDKLSLTLGSSRFHFDIDLAADSLNVLLGRSGSGKSTLLNLIAGFTQADSGTLRWNGESLLALPPDRRPVNTLFQHHNLFAHLSVADNVGLGVHPGLRLTREQRHSVDKVLADVGLDGHAAKLPAALSGGEQQRVALARCLLRDKPVLLMDEPFGALDGATRREMLALTRSVISERSPCTIVVTHDPDDAQALGADVLRIVDGHVVRDSTATR